jgi:hypothetical protein
MGSFSRLSGWLSGLSVGLGGAERVTGSVLQLDTADGEDEVGRQWYVDEWEEWSHHSSSLN